MDSRETEKVLSEAAIGDLPSMLSRLYSSLDKFICRFSFNFTSFVFMECACAGSVLSDLSNICLDSNGSSSETTESLIISLNIG